MTYLEMILFSQQDLYSVSTCLNMPSALIFLISLITVCSALINGNEPFLALIYLFLQIVKRLFPNHIYVIQFWARSTFICGLPLTRMPRNTRSINGLPTDVISKTSWLTVQMKISLCCIKAILLKACSFSKNYLPWRLHLHYMLYSSCPCSHSCNNIFRIRKIMQY